MNVKTTFPVAIIAAAALLVSCSSDETTAINDPSMDTPAIGSDQSSDSSNSPTLSETTPGIGETTPTGPSTPAETESTSDPTKPSEPNIPTDSTGTIDPIIPTDPTTPTDPANPSEPSNSIIATDPTVPTDPVIPTNPADSTEPSVPTEPAIESNGNSPSITYTANGATISNDNGCVTINGGEVIISCAGDYDLSGSYKGNDGQIRVNASKADSAVYLNLRGLTLENTEDAPIYIQNASKTFIVAKNGTVNTLTDAANRTKTFNYTNASGESKMDTTGATIYAKDDLTIKGEGSLTVNGNYNNGIQSSNDIKIKKGSLTVSAKNNGIKGKGSVEISGGEVNVTTTEGDGIKSDECVVTQDTCSAAVEGKGIVAILGGKVTVKAGDDGIYGYSAVIISDSAEVPTIKVTAGTGTPNT
ncbi:MAG: carbohydrate-binding domain-containing protein, partial [Fibrobacter sp.]|nr:carbohydrate-binding domain-containing protein [Fibrobacter sp.]